MRRYLVTMVIFILALVFWAATSHVLAASGKSRQQSSAENSPVVVNDDTSAEETSNTECQMSELARSAINDAKAVERHTWESLGLIRQAEAVAGPPECDRFEARILADKAKRLAKENDISLNTPGPATEITKSMSPVLGLNFGSMTFDDDIFSGSGRIFGFTLGVSFNSHYEIAYEYNSNAAFDFMFDDLFLSEPSLDKGRDLVDFEDVHIKSQLLYLRGNWPISETIAGFALVGYSKIEIEIDKTTFNCGPLFPIIPVYLNEDGVGSTTTYRNKESGIAWGVGLQWKPRPHSYLSLKYIDQSVDDFDFSGIYLAWGLRD